MSYQWMLLLNSIGIHDIMFGDNTVSKLFLNKRWVFFIIVFVILVLVGILDIKNDTPLSAAVILIEDRVSGAFPWIREYHIGYFDAKLPVWEKAYIPKNKKTTKYIERYYKKTISKFR